MTNALNNLINTVGTIASKAASNLLYDFSIPLGIVNLIQTVIANTQANPNTPQIPNPRAPREWFSQPSSATRGAPPRVTVFYVDGTHTVFDVNDTGVLGASSAGPILSTLADLLDPTLCVFQQIDYPASALPMGGSCAQGVQTLSAAIQQLTTPFILSGYSQGAAVVSLVLEELQTGSLTPYLPQLIAGVTFGNICRQEGKFAPVPGATDPGGHGLWMDHLLTDTPALWWDFALPDDIACTVNSDDYGEDVGAILSLLMAKYYGTETIPQFIANNIANLPGSVVTNLGLTIPNLLNLPTHLIADISGGFESIANNLAAIITVVEILASFTGLVPVPPGVQNFAPHGEYTILPPAGSTSTLTCVEQAALYINTVADQWQAAYRFTNPTEVLTVNLKLPLSVGHLAFQVIRVPCTVTAWYQDRNGHWIQLTDESNSPIQLNVAYSAVTSWFQFSTYVYPVIATAVQLRITRNYNPQMGDTSYVVGIKELLIQRYVYSIDDTKMAIADSADVLGNTITSYVKSWGPQKAIDNDPTTFWKSFPCPDPNGVVAFYLDTRDSGGNAQLIDTLYIDPTYTGNTLNLYYSNDSAQGTLIINPVNLTPDVSINTVWTQGVGLTDIEGMDIAVSQLSFPTSFGPLNQTPIWIGIEWTPNFSPGSGPANDPILWGVNPLVNTVQMVTIEGDPTSGTFCLIDETNNKASVNIPYNASAATVQSALTSSSLFGTGNVSVTGNNGGPWDVEFIGSLAGQQVPVMGVLNALEGGTDPSVTVESIEGGITPPYLTSNTYWPTIYYDVGAGWIVVEFQNGTTIHSHHLALNPAFTANQPLQIVVGWNYNPSMLFISVTQNNIHSLGEVTINPATDLPDQITLDGESGYTGINGLMTAIVIKQDSWTNGYLSFQGSPVVYANPNPVQPDSNGNYPSTTLDNAILACDWTSQSLPIGGTSESWYENKVWTPIFQNYFTQKGNLFLPQKISMSYLKMEFTNLTPEPYPVYDQGISVTYDTFPVSATQTSVTAAGGILGLAGNAANTLLTVGSGIITNSIGSVNWFNPQTIQNAINANFGTVQQPVVVQTGPGTLTTSLPNVAQSNISGSYRTEASSPWVYNRQMLSASSLAGQNITQISNSPTSAQTLQSSTDPASTQIQQSFTPVTTSSKSNVLPQQGSDWWLFPGANFQLPAALMDTLTLFGAGNVGTAVTNAVNAVGNSLANNANVATGTAVTLANDASSAGSKIANAIGTIVYRPPSTATRVRFTGNIVHRYEQNTLLLTSAVAYFAGLNEVQAYVTSYIATNDPKQFSYSQYTLYDPTTGTGDFTNDNITQLPSGPISTAGTPYVLENPNFLYPLELDPWTATGDWYWSSSGGLGFASGESAAAVNASGSLSTLISEPIAVTPGDEITIGVWVSYEDLISGGEVAFPVNFPYTFDSPVPEFPVTFPFNFDTGGASFPLVFPFTLAGDGAIALTGVAYDGTTAVGTVSFNMPSTTATYTVTTQAQMLALSSATVGQSCTITQGDGGFQGTYLLTATPASNFTNWELTGYGTYIYNPSGSSNTTGAVAIPLTGTYTVPEGVTSLALSLNVTGNITSGTVYFNNVTMNPSDGIEGMVSLNAVTTSTFSNVSIEVSDSGLVNSDSLWARLDPLDTNIDNLLLAPYVSTYPSSVPSGVWGDTFASWDDPIIDWGESLGTVQINVDPNLIYNGNRALHFTRAAGAGNAGVIMTQLTNMYANEPCQLGCTFYKPAANTNQLEILLRRVSDGVVVHTETFTPPFIGVWYTYQGQFFSLPDTTDQVYTLEFYATGNAADEIYLSDLFCNLSGIQYMFQLGSSGAPNFDVTPLVYADNTNISVTVPTNEFTFTALIWSPRSFAYGVTITPRYLK